MFWWKWSGSTTMPQYPLEMTIDLVMHIIKMDLFPNV